MAPARILIVDDDEWTLRMVDTALTAGGYETLTATDGEQAWAIAQRHHPDLVITDVMMPVMDGWALVQRLRTNPNTAMIPVIFLTALAGTESRLQGLQLGADDYLAKPFVITELELRVASVLRRCQLVKQATLEQARRTEPHENPGIRGTLDQLGVSALLMVLNMERKSGVLMIQRDKEIGRIFLSEGNVVKARLEGERNLENQEVINTLLEWTRGRFEFSALEVDMEDTVRIPTTNLLLEAARIHDEVHRDDARLQEPAADASAPEIDLPIDE